MRSRTRALNGLSAIVVGLVLLGVDQAASDDVDEVVEWLLPEGEARFRARCFR